MKDCWKWR